MAPGAKKPAKSPVSRAERRRDAKRSAAPVADTATVADPDAAPDPDAEDAPDEEAPPLNRAERRLAAKRKNGRSAPTRVTPNGMSSTTDAMRGRGVQGPGGSMKGTNTRRSG